MNSRLIFLLYISLSSISFCTACVRMVQPASAEHIRQEHSTLHNELLQNPVAVLVKNQQTQQKVYAALMRDSKTHNENEYENLWENEENTEHLIQSMKDNHACYNEINPIYQLDECTNCYVSRSYKPLRALLEEDCAQAALTACNRNDGSAHIVDFACGNLFSTLMIALRTLAKGARDVGIHVLDLKFRHYTDLVRLYNNGEIQAHASEIVRPIDRAYKEIKKRKKHLVTRLADYMATKNKAEVFRSLYSDHTLFSQFSLWTKAFYPDQSCTLYIHPDVEEYKQFVRQNPDCTADVITTCDWDEIRKPNLDNIKNDWSSLLEFLFLKSRKKHPVQSFNLVKPLVLDLNSAPYISRISHSNNDHKNNGYAIHTTNKRKTFIKWRKQNPGS